MRWHKMFVIKQKDRDRCNEHNCMFVSQLLLDFPESFIYRLDVSNFKVYYLYSAFNDKHCHKASEMYIPNKRARYDCGKKKTCSKRNLWSSSGIVGL